MKFLRLLTLVILVSLCFGLNAQVLDYNDPIVEYDPNNAPAKPGTGVLVDWVRTKAQSWNTDKWKAYYLSGLPFRLRFPNNYDPNRAEEYPVIVIIHGLGYSNRPAEAIYENERHLGNSGAKAYEDAINQNKFDGFILSPASLTGWFDGAPANIIIQILDHMDQDLNVNLDRVSLVGRSGGAISTWSMIDQDPRPYAAVLPLAGINKDANNWVDKLKHIQMWIHQGELDDGPGPWETEPLLEQLTESGANVRYTKYWGRGHGIFNQAYAEPDYFDFMTRAHKANPAVLEGIYAQTFENSYKVFWEWLPDAKPCPGDPINIRIGLTPGFNGYEWRKDGEIIPGATGNEIIVTELGVYDARYRRGNTWSEWSPQPVEVVLKDPTVTPDIQIEGNESAVIPSLDGNTSVALELPQGFAEYEWRNANDVVVGTERVFVATSPGNYVASVTENLGCSSSPSAPFNVIDANGVNKPQNLLDVSGAAISKTEIRLIISANPNDPNPATGFEIYKSELVDGQYDYITTIPGDQFEYVDSELLPDSDYFYKVRAVNDQGGSNGTSSGAIRTQVDQISPTAPSNLVLTDASSYSATLSWTESTDDVGVYQYEIYRDGFKVSTSNITTAEIFNLESNRIYTFMVKAVDLTGNESAFSNRLVISTAYSAAASANLQFNGNLSDESPSNTNNSVSGSISYSGTEVIEGAQSIEFNGNSYIDFDRNDVFIHDAFQRRSIAFWFKSTDTSGTQDMFDEGGATNGIGIRLVNETIDLTVQDNHSIYSLTAPCTRNEWHHVVGTFNAGELKLYLDGQLVAQRDDINYAGDEVSAHSDGAGLGGTNGSNAFDVVSSGFRGFMDDLYVFGSVLSLTDVQSLYNIDGIVSIPNEIVNAPEDVVATALSYDKIEVSWADVSDNEIQFQISRSEENGPSLPVALVSANETSFIDESLQPATKYAYQVIALSQYNESGSSAAASIPSIGHYTFEGNYNDQSSNNINTGRSGTVTYNNDSQQGSSAIYFNGNAYLDPDTGNKFIHDAFNQRSVAFWYKSEDAGGNQDIFDEGGSTNGIGIRLLGTDIQLTVQNGHQIFSVQAPATRNEWHHVVGIFDNGSLRLYLDGSLVAERDDVSYTTVNDHGNGAGIGGTNSSNAFDVVSSRFTGLIDDFYFFDTAVDDMVNQIIQSANPVNVATTFDLPPAPAAPSDLVLNDAGYDFVDFSFEDTSDNEDYFEIFRAINAPSNFQSIEILEAADGGTVNYVDESLESNITYYYKVASVNAGGSVESANLGVSTLNYLPELVSLPDQITMQYGSDYELSILASDQDSDELVISVTNEPSFATLIDYGDGSGLLRFSPSTEDGGNYENITITISDAFGGEVSHVLSLEVNGNSLPELSEVSSLTVSEGEVSAFQIVATDEEGVDNLTWEYNLPDFVSYTLNLGGILDVEVSPDYIDHGIYAASVSVEDQDGASTTIEFDIEVIDVDPNTNVLVNFAYTTQASSPWNNISTLGTHQLLTTSGEQKGITLEFITNAWSAYQDGAQTGNDSGVFPDDVLKDYYYFGIFGAPNTVQFKVTGLDPNTAYDFSFLASSVWSGAANNGSTVFTIDGVSETLAVQGNTQNTADFDGIYSAANGEVVVTMAKAANTPVGYINGFSINTSYGLDQVPAAPKDLTASLGERGVGLQWKDAPFNESGFRIYRSDDGGVNYNSIDEVGAGIQSYEDTNVSQGIEYLYVVTSYNANGESDNSNSVSFTVPNTAPKITITGSTSLLVNQSSTLVIETTDAPEDIVSVDATSLPSFASFSTTATGGEVNFVPTLDDIGNYTFNISASDNQGASTTTQVQITVSEEKLYGIAINFSQNSNQGGNWNNTSKAPANGDTFSNLVDDTGANTPVSLSLLTSFGGVYNETLVTGDNSGMVPDNVLREYYWWGIFNAPNEVRMRVAGLDYNNKYTFKFVGSSTFSQQGITDNGETVYTIGNKSVSVYVQGNTETFGELSDITADLNGEVVISMTKGNGASAGYINGLIIEAYPGDVSIFNPSDLTASGTSRSTINLSWSDNSFDEESFEIYRSTSRNGTFNLVGTVGADATTFQDSGLNGGQLYFYKVRAKFGENDYSTYTETVSSGTISFYMYVNINGEPAYNASTPWNNLGVEAASGAVFTGFKNQDGNPTGISMEVVNGMQGSNDWGTVQADDPSVTAIYPDNVSKSFYFNDALETPGRFKLMGLDAGFSYNITFFGSINHWYNVFTNFSSNGTTVTNSQTLNLDETVTIYGLDVDETNSIEFEVQEGSNSPWAIFNAFVVEAYPREGNPAARTVNNNINVAGDYVVIFGNEDLKNDFADFSFYPNPVQDKINIHIGDNIQNEVSIIVFDLRGNALIDRRVIMNPNQTSISFTEGISDLERGVYILSVKIGEEMKTKRIIKD